MNQTVNNKGENIAKITISGNETVEQNVSVIESKFFNRIQCLNPTLFILNNSSINSPFWKDSQQNEVDFVIKDGLKISQLIQVCYALDHTKTQERAIRALLKASQELHCDNLLIISRDKEAEETAEWFGFKQKIRYLPLWKRLTL